MKFGFDENCSKPSTNAFLDAPTVVNRGSVWESVGFEYFCALHAKNMLLYVQHEHSHVNTK